MPHRDDIAHVSEGVMFCGWCGRQMKVMNDELPTVQHSPPIAIDILYQQGLEALALGNNEFAVSLLQQVLDVDPNFEAGKLASQVKKLWDRQARQAHFVGDWTREAAAWEGLLKLEPLNTYVAERVCAAKSNQHYALLYRRAKRCIDIGDISLAKKLLREIWRNNRYYGDPVDLAKIVGLKVPLPLSNLRRIEWIGLWIGFVCAFLAELFLVVATLRFHSPPTFSGFLVVDTLGGALTTVFGAGLWRMARHWLLIR